MQKSLRVFISSPRDVKSARRIAADTVNAMAEEYRRFFQIEEPYLWEQEPKLAPKAFQDLITPPSKFDIVLLILWSRLGTNLPPQSPVREYRGIDGRVPVTGTEWEYEDALAAARASNGIPDILVFRDFNPALVDMEHATDQQDDVAQIARLTQFWQRHFKDGEEFRGSFNDYRSLEEFESKLKQQLRAVLDRRAAAMTSTGESPPAVWLKSPFRGLESYEFEHAPIYRGRGRLVAKAVEQLCANSSRGMAFLLVCGPSGSGKSSLVKAGMVPRLMKPRRVPGVEFVRRVIFRPASAGSEGNLILALARTLVSTGAEADVGLPELLASGQQVAQLERHLRASAADPGFIFAHALAALTQVGRASGRMLDYQEAKLILVVDQLEEIFTAEAMNLQERRLFLQMLQGLARSDAVWVVATIRADFWHRALELPELADMADSSGRIDVPPPTDADLIEMVRKPAGLAGVTFEDEETRHPLDAVLIEEAGAEPGVLPLLSFTLNALYAEDVLTNYGHMLTHRTYEALGGLRGAIGQRAGNVFGALPEDERKALPIVLRALVTVREGTKATAQSAPYSQFAEGSPQRRLVDAFLAPQARLLVTEAAVFDAEPRVRLAHEALLTHWPLARDQIEKDRADLKLRAELSTRWEWWKDANRDPSFLIPAGRPLDQAIDLTTRQSGELNPLLKSFVTDSVAARDQHLKHEEATRSEAKRVEAQWARPLAPLPKPEVAGPPVRVFVSSPADVGAERQAAQRVIDRVAQEFAPYFPVEPIMWELGAYTPLQAFQSAQTLDQADIFVLILGSRMGTVLPGGIVGAISRKTGLTASEWEFEKALASFRKEGRPEMLYFRKKSTLSASFDNPGQVRELLRQQAAVEEFTRRWFNAADGGGAYTTFATTEEFDRQFYVSLHSLLDRRLPGRQTQ